jgi:hypothetical protein
MKPQFFYSRDDKSSTQQLEDMFRRQGIYFIEHIESQRWLVELTGMGPVTTNDPNACMRFNTFGDALTFRVKNPGLWQKRYQITEHEFPKA